MISSSQTHTKTNTNHHTLIIVGGGAAGLFCAVQLGNLGLKPLILEKNSKPGKKILISGGGRCNFTNINAHPMRYYSQHPHFCKAALRAYGPERFIQYIKEQSIAFHEKHLGQLFCNQSSLALLNSFLHDIHRYQGKLITQCPVEKIEFPSAKPDDSGSSPSVRFILHTPTQIYTCEYLVLATGGLSYPEVGVSDLGYRVAQKVGHTLSTLKPGLVPFNYPPHQSKLCTLAGVSLPCTLRCNKSEFTEDLLFTHWGLSGPALLQISCVWEKGKAIHINLLPQISLDEKLNLARQEHPKMLLANYLSQFLPKRLAFYVCEEHNCLIELGKLTRNSQKKIVAALQHWEFCPPSTRGYSKAEVTLGGIATPDIIPGTCESRKKKGMYLIGELVDVTGWLGGYNFQWAWSSAYVAAQSLATQIHQKALKPDLQSHKPQEFDNPTRSHIP